MRYWLMSVAALFFLVSLGDSQEGKKKDAGKEKEPKSSQPTEPTEIQGRSYADWRKDIKDKDPSKRETAIKAVLQFGPAKSYEALPDILAELKKHNPPKSAVDLNVRVTGVMAVSTIFKYHKDPEEKLIKDAVAVYRTCLKDEQMMVKMRAAQGLAYLGPACRDALPEIQKMSKEPLTWEARKEAVQVLGMIGFEDSGKPKVLVLADVFKALEDRSYQVRIAALRATSSLAMKTDSPLVKSQVFAKFKTAQADEDKHVVLAAHLAQMTLEGKVSPPHINPMIKLLKDPNPEVRLDALQNISILGKEAKSATPALTQCTDDPEITVAVNAVMVLAAVDLESSQTLFTRIRDNTKYPEQVRAAAAEAVAFHKMSKEKKTVDKK
jgi:HEAT repeat protein